MVATFLKIIIVYVLAISIVFNANCQEHYFIKNKGQIVDQDGNFNPKVLFLYSGIKYNVAFYKDHFTYEVFKLLDQGEDVYRANRIELWYANPNRNIKVMPQELFNTNSNFYKNGHSFLNLAGCSKLVYENVWDGIDIEFAIEQNRLKYNFIVSENAKNNFSIDIRGANISKGDDGVNLICGDLLIQEKTPFSYIYTKGNKEIYGEVKTKVRRNKLTYLLPRSRYGKVMIDPIAYGMKYSTYYGGASIDYIYSVDAFSDQQIIVGGYTLSTNNIATNGAYQTTIVDFDAFIAKFDSLGNRVWGTYMGGTGFDRSYALTVDFKDNIIVSGNTMSSSGIATLGTHQQVLQSADDAFIMKFNSAGQLIWGTYYGGNDHDFIADITVDSLNNICITGHTQSTNFPISLTAHNKILDSVESAFLGVLDSSGNLIHSTYYGLGNYDGGMGIEAASDGSVFMSGYTSSSNEIAYGISNQAILSGQKDGFLVKFSKDYQPIWGTYVGGSSIDECMDLSLDDSLNVFIAGNTSSNNQIATTGSYQDSLNGSDDAFMIKFDSLGSLLWGTYIGGEGVDYIQAIDYKYNTIWLCGYSSSDNYLTDSSSINQQNKGNYDNLILRYDLNGNKLWGTFSGGLNNDFCQDIIILKNQEVVFGGFTESFSNISTANAHQVAHGGNQYDSFWSKICQPTAVSSISVFEDVFFCEGDSIVVNSINYFPHYLWSSGDTTSAITITSSDKYWLNTRDSNQCPGRSDTLEVNVISPAQITINASKNVLCEDDSINLSVNPDYASYLWSNGLTLFQQNINDSGKYWLQAIDSLGCSHYSDTILVKKAQIIYPVNSVGSTTICQGGSVILYASSLLNSFVWNIGATTPSILVDTAGSFWFTAIDSNFCNIKSDTLNVILANYPNPVAALDTAGTFLLCPADTIVFQADSGFSGYLWSDGSSSQEISISTPGVYYVIVSDSNGCTAISDTAIVNSPSTIPPKVLLPNGNSLCKNDSVIIFADSSFSSVLWNNGSTEHELHADTPQTLFYTAIDSFGCSYSSDTIHLSWFPIQDPAISILLTDSIYCMAQIIPLEINPQNYISYNWQNGDTTVLSSFSSSIPGDFWQTISVIDSNNCQEKDSILITIEICQGMIANRAIDQVIVYPAITDQIINISSNIGIKDIIMMDESGKTIFKKKCNSNRNATINMERYSNGIYILKIFTKWGGPPEIKKIVKK
ncbi:MAG TPA: T9SS type A sorting domain-containing protein [Flavobacteriales bacterium]|nr:T9SS type A sorting domain-containing protein [Flavobacteriales bacterium]